MQGSQGKVVNLMAYRGEAAQPPEFLQMEGFWQALRGADGSLPERAHFDPRGISVLLGSTLLLERISQGEVRIRLAGMALHELLGMELRGMPLSALAVPTSRISLSERVARVFDTPAIARLNFSAEPGFARPACSARLLLLPMIGPSGAVDRALGALLFTGSLGRVPRRLVLEGGHVERIRGLPAAPMPALSSDATAPALPATEFAEAAASFAPAPRPQAPYLRLVKD